MASFREERAVEQRRLDDRDLQAPEERTGLIGNRRVAKDVVEQKRHHVHRDGVSRIRDAIIDRRADVRYQVERDDDLGSAVGRVRTRNVRKRRIEVVLLPLPQCLEQRRRHAQRHQRIKAG